MEINELHFWEVTPREAIALQTKLASEVVCEGGPADVRLVAACDVAFIDRPILRRPDLARAAVVVLSYPELEVVEQHIVQGPARFPYIPGLLSFREIPALSLAFERVRSSPDLVIADGHGYAHPRRFGLASHLGLMLGVPTIGCAKSRLCGEEITPAPERGAIGELFDKGELIGAVLRTRTGVKPVYVSAGHRISLQQATEWTLRLAPRYRLPEPIRIADRLSKGYPYPALPPA